MVDATTLAITRADASGLLAAAVAGWNVPVPDCPGWDQAQLVRHVGGIFAWMTAVVESGEYVKRRSVQQAPAEPAALATWYLRNLDQTLEILSAADPGATTWTFSSVGDHRVAWWIRRLAVEVAIHRWDAERSRAGADGPPPLDADVGAAGVEEFVTEFLPALLARDDTGGLTGTLHLHATDGPIEWTIDLDTGMSIAGHSKADTAVRGTRTDLLLWNANRRPANIEVLGRRETVERWTLLQR